MLSELVLIPVGGLANRLLAISSAVKFCQDYHAKLKIYWFKDWGMGADFYDLFDNYCNMNVEIIDVRWSHRVYDRPRKRNLWLPYFWQYFYFDVRIYDRETSALGHGEKLISKLLASKKAYLVEWSPFYKEKEFTLISEPSFRVNKMIDDVYSLFSNYTIGIHIRRTDHIDAIKNSPTSLFIDKIYMEIEKKPLAKFYLASDSMEDKMELISVFGDKIITSKKIVRRDTKEGIIDAFVELSLLSKTKKIYGSFNSTFSLLASKICNIELEYIKK